MRKAIQALRRAPFHLNRPLVRLRSSEGGQVTPDVLMWAFVGAVVIFAIATFVSHDLKCAVIEAIDKVLGKQPPAGC